MSALFARMRSIAFARTVGALLALGFVSLLVYAQAMRGAPCMYLDVVLQATTASTAEAYYAGDNEPLSEQRVSRQAYPVGESRLLLPINVAAIAKLRFDPTQIDAPVTVTRLRLIDRAGVVIDNIGLQRVVSGNQIRKLTLTGNTLLIEPQFGATDAGVTINIPPAQAAARSTIPDVLFVTLALLPLAWLLRRRDAVAAMAVACMARCSGSPSDWGSCSPARR